MAVDVPTNQPIPWARSETEMSRKTSGASARARSTHQTAPTTAKGSKRAKSAKADGTPKQRWTAAERRDSGRPPRRSAGRQYEDPRGDGRSSSEDGRSRRYDRDDRPRTD